MRKKGFTLIELLVVIAIIAMLMAILMPALSKVKKIAMRVVCGTNLKGLGTAQTVYANDYDDQYVVQGQRGLHTWGFGTDQFQNVSKDWSTPGDLTIAASLYLLVREADVSPKSFVCPSGDEQEYDGKNTANPPKDIVELWDFGYETLAAESGYPYQHVSYAYHMPYAAAGGQSPYAATGTLSAAFAVMADKNPFLDPKLTSYLPVASVNSGNLQESVCRMGDYYLTNSTYTESSPGVRAANSQPHDRESQNVLFADGHTANEKTTDVGIQNDAIYLAKGGAGTDEDMRRQGLYAPMSAEPVHDLTVCQPTTISDSFLVNDDVSNLADRPI